MTAETTTPNGWLVDLSADDLQRLVGATVTLFMNLKAATGLLTGVKDGNANLYRPDTGKHVSFLVAGTRFERTPGTPMRPALARALTHHALWADEHKQLMTENGELRPGISHRDYDRALSRHVEAAADIHEDLLAETASLLA
ncbi:hypothetical protein ACWEDZ_02795 [Streptomyces sp. NPDC005047]